MKSISQSGMNLWEAITKMISAKTISAILEELEKISTQKIRDWSAAAQRNLARSIWPLSETIKKQDQCVRIYRGAGMVAPIHFMWEPATDPDFVGYAITKVPKLKRKRKGNSTKNA